MAIWHYTISVVPAEALQELPPNRTQDFLSSFATPDGYDFSTLWGFRQQQGDELRATISQFFKPCKDAVGAPAFGSLKRSLLIVQETDGIVTDLVCKIDVRAMQEMRQILTEILSIAQVHKLIGVHDEYGIIALADAFHLLRSISQSRAVRYVRDPQAYLDRLHESNKMSQTQAAEGSQQSAQQGDGSLEADSNATPPEASNIAS